LFQQTDRHTGGGNVAGVFLASGPPLQGGSLVPRGSYIVPTQASWRALTAAVVLLLGWPAHAAAPAASSALPAGKTASAAHAAASQGLGTKAGKPAKPVKAAKPIDLNNASKAQLLTLPGIGDAEAERIIAKRPFNSKAAIVTDAGIPAGVYLANRRSIFVGPVAKPKPKPVVKPKA
jgi:hypothetical protein